MRSCRESFQCPDGTMIAVVKAVGYAHWASYFINGDASGFDYSNTRDDPNAGDRELALADAFAKWIGGPIVDVEGEPFFDNPDNGGLFGECLVYVAHVRETPPAPRGWESVQS